MAWMVGKLRPRIFLFENVRGLLTSKWSKDNPKKIFESVLTEFQSIPRYTVKWSLVRAKDYGVPQNRPRVLLVGIRNDILERTEFADHDTQNIDAVQTGFLPFSGDFKPADLIDLWSDLEDPSIPEVLQSGNFPQGRFMTESYPNDIGLSDVQKFLRTKPSGDLMVGAELSEQEYSKHNPNIVSKFLAMHESGGIIPEQFKTKKFSQRLLRKRWGNQPPNITATSLADDYVHYSQPRSLTVREWARLQMFPDWYEFAGKRTTGGLRRAGNPREGNFDREVPKYTQIGNAVPVELARQVGLHFQNILNQAESNKR